MKTYNAGTHLGLLLTRATLGGYLMLAGWGKVTTELDKGIGYFYKENFLGLAPDWLPGWFAAPYGYALPWLELLVGGMLVLGLFTRFAAFLASGTMAVAYFMVHAPQSLYPILNGGELAALYSFVFVYLAAAGPGPISIDRIIGRG